MKIVYIGKTIESIDYFKSLINNTNNYQLVNTFLYSGDYKKVIASDEIDCAVFELTEDECSDYQMTKYLKEIDCYVVCFGNKQVGEFVNFGINADVNHVDFLNNKSSDVKINSYFASLANNIIEFNVREFFDPYINDCPITFGDEELERFVTFLTCRKKKYINSTEIMDALYPDYTLADKKVMKYRALACMFQTFLAEVGLTYLFNYNDKMCVFNYHLVQSDFYLYLKGEFEGFDRKYLDTINFDFESVIASEAEDRKIRGELDNIEFFYGDEVYVDFEPEELEDDFNLAIVQEEKEYEEDFMDKAIRFSQNANRK